MLLDCDEPVRTLSLCLAVYPCTRKSTLAIYLAKELSRAFLGTYGKTLAHFFCDSGFQIRKMATSVIRGLLLQLV